MNLIDYDYAFKVYKELDGFDFTIEESFNKNIKIKGLKCL